MASTTNKNNRLCPEDWVSLKSYFESKMEAVEKATTLANENLKVRLESLNEWRAQNREERATFITRNEFETKLEHLLDDRRANISIWISLAALLSSVLMKIF